MIPKSGNRFSEKIMRGKRHDPVKWKPVFGSCAAKGMIPKSGNRFSEKIMRALTIIQTVGGP
jgi:hypothetical protein